MPNLKYSKNGTTHIKQWTTIKYLMAIGLQLSEIGHDSSESRYAKLQGIKMKMKMEGKVGTIL